MHLTTKSFPRLPKQEKVGRELDKTSESLDIKRKLSNEGNELLQQMLQNISQTQRGLPGMNSKQTQQSRQDVATQLEG